MTNSELASLRIGSILVGTEIEPGIKFKVVSIAEPGHHCRLDYVTSGSNGKHCSYNATDTQFDLISNPSDSESGTQAPPQVKPEEPKPEYKPDAEAAAKFGIGPDGKYKDEQAKDDAWKRLKVGDIVEWVGSQGIFAPGNPGTRSKVLRKYTSDSTRYINVKVTSKSSDGDGSDVGENADRNWGGSGSKCHFVIVSEKEAAQGKPQSGKGQQPKDKQDEKEQPQGQIEYAAVSDLLELTKAFLTELYADEFGHRTIRKDALASNGKLLREELKAAIEKADKARTESQTPSEA